MEETVSDHSAGTTHKAKHLHRYSYGTDVMGVWSIIVALVGRLLYEQAMSQEYNHSQNVMFHVNGSNMEF